MADWYCDHSLAQAAYADYASTPTAAGTVPTKAEDGNGKATGVASMATLVVAFTGLPSADQAVTVAGVTFTAKASGATGNQFNIGADATATATNLKTAINASTTNATKPIGVIAATAPLRNIVNATSSGGTVTVYTRIAGSEWNSVTETSTLSNCTVTQWSGGTDGAWGYFFNTAAIAWPGSVAVGTYGGPVATYLNAPAAGDTMHARTERSGANITLTWPTSSTTVTTRAVGTFALPFVVLFDNGVKWSGDSGQFTMSMDGSSTANRTFRLPSSANKQIFKSASLSETTRGFRVEITGTLQAGNYSFDIGGNVSSTTAAFVLDGVEICGASGAALNNVNSAHNYVRINSVLNSLTPMDVSPSIVKNLVFKSQGKASPFGSISTSYPAQFRVESSIFDHTGLTQASDESIVHAGSGAPGDIVFDAVGCQWLGFPAASNQSGFQKFAARNTAMFSLRDCSFSNIKVSGGTTNGGLVGSTEATAGGAHRRSISIVSSLGNRPYVWETSAKAIAWFDSAAPRVTSSLLPDGTTSFSVRTAVTSESGKVAPLHPVMFPRLAKHNTLADGDRTATLRILVDNNIRTALGGRDPKNDEMWVEVSYVGTDGKPKRVSSRAEIGATPTSISAGTAGDWSATSYDVNGVTHNYTAFELSVSCPGMETLTECGVEFVQGCQSSSVDNLVFLDPDWTLA